MLVVGLSPDSATTWADQIAYGLVTRATCLDYPMLSRACTPATPTRGSKNARVGRMAHKASAGSQFPSTASSTRMSCHHAEASRDASKEECPSNGGSRVLRPSALEERQLLFPPLSYGFHADCLNQSNSATSLSSLQLVHCYSGPHRVDISCLSVVRRIRTGQESFPCLTSLPVVLYRARHVESGEDEVTGHLNLQHVIFLP